MARAEAPAAERKRSQGSLLELVAIVVVALGIALGVQAFLVKPFRIPSESMVPTLAVTQRVLVDRVSFLFAEPHRGDIVVFNPPIGADASSGGGPVEGTPVRACGVGKSDEEACPRPNPRHSNANFIKRIVGEPGDRLKVMGGRVYINGTVQKEPFIAPDEGCDGCNLPQEITVPPGHFFMMGDNRGHSTDSRFWGPVPKDWMVGNAFFTYWPPGRVGSL